MTVASTRITLLFSLLGGSEVAATGFGMFPTPSPSQEAMEDLADAARSAFMTEFWDSAPSAFFPNSTSFLGARAQTFDVNNHLVATGDSLLSTPAAGGSTSSTLPPGVAEVVSLRTTSPGARGRGRMYLPAMHVGMVTATGRLGLTDQTSVATAMRDFFDTFNASPLSLGAAVVSQAGSSVTAISAIRVGNVFDSQRRRRDDLTEVYVSEALA